MYFTYVSRQLPQFVPYLCALKPCCRWSTCLLEPRNISFSSLLSPRHGLGLSLPSSLLKRKLPSKDDLNEFIELQLVIPNNNNTINIHSNPFIFSSHASLT